MGANNSKYQVNSLESLGANQPEIHEPAAVGYSSRDQTPIPIGFSIVTKNKNKGTVQDHFYGVPAENYGFIDRPNILAKVDAALGNNSPFSGCKIVALTGLGGMGKTQLMLRYCYLHRTTYKYIFWLEVDNWNTAINSFHQLAINLGLNVESTWNKDSEESIIEQVISWLKMKTDWLLLLNNADNDDMEKKVFKLIPRIGGDVILSTRIKVPSRKAVVIHVDKMQEDEAICLLLGTSSVDQQNIKFRYAQEIVTELGCMPLATRLARAYLDNTGTSFQHYLNMLKTRRGVLFRYYDEDTIDQYQHTISTVWQISLEQVRAQNSTAVEILKACTFFQPENIPVCFFERHYAALDLHPIPLDPLEDKKKSEQESIQDNEQAIRRAIAVLIKFSFVTRTWNEVEDNDDPASDLLTTHRLVQQVIYDTLSSEQKLHWARKIAAVLNSETYFSLDAIFSTQTRMIMDVYLSHIRQFATLIAKLDQKPFMSKDLRNVLDRKVHYLMGYGTYSDVEESAQLSIQISHAMGDIDGSENLEFGMSLHNLARLYENQGKYDMAEPLYQRVLAINEVVLGSEHPNTALSLNSLALLYDNQGKYDEAKPLYQRALAICENKLGSEHPDTATSLSNLALLYCNQSKYDEAEPLYQRALAIREKVLGSEHPNTATSFNNLAVLHYSQGKYDKAEPLYQRALAICEKVLGHEHPNTAASLNSLAFLYCKQGKYHKAEILYQRALAICEKVLGSEHPNTALSLNSLASLYCNQGKYNEAEPLYQRALAIREKVLGSEHPNTAGSLNDLALFYDDQGKYYEAEPLYQRALAIYERVVGSEHPNTALSLNNLASLYYKQGKYEEAEPLYQRALAIYEKVLGSEHTNTAMTLNNLALLYNNQGKYDKVKPLYQRALAIYEKMLGAEHPDTATSLNNLALLYDNQGKYDEAEPLYHRALAIREKTLGSEHPNSVMSRNNLVTLYERRGKYDEARLLR